MHLKNENYSKVMEVYNQIKKPDQYTFKNFNQAIFEISRKVKILCEDDQSFDDALIFINALPENIFALNEKLFIYISKKDFKTAVEIYKSIKNPNKKTQEYYFKLKKELSKEVTNLCEKESFDEALDLLNLIDTQNTVLLNQKMSIYKNKKDFHRAIEVYKQIKRPDQITKKYYEIIIKEIPKEAMILCQKEDFGEALSLISLLDPNDSIKLIMQMLIYSLKKEFEKALDIYIFLDKNDEYVKKVYHTLEFKLSCEVKDLTDKKLYNEALELLNLLDTQNTVLLNQKMSVYISLKEYKKAKEVYDNILNANNKTIEYYGVLQNELMTVIDSLVNEGNVGGTLEYAELLEESTYKKQIMSLFTSKKLEDNEASFYLTKLYNDTLIIEEIDSSNLEDYKKEIFKMAYCEKYNLNYNINALKKLKSVYEENKKVLKIINKLLVHSKRKLKLFDFGFYEEVLSCEISLENEMKF